MSQARRYSGLGKGKLKSLAMAGEIDGGKTDGGHWRFDRESIDRYFNREGDIALAMAGSSAP